MALHAAFPRIDATWIAPLAFAGLFLCWFGASVRTALLSGYLAGVAFFWVDFAWFGETAGALVGPLAPLLSLGPALVEASAFAAAALVAALAWRRAGPRGAPVVAAAGFATAEWLRSTGVLGVPFGQLGVALIATPLAPIAAFAGGYGITFAVALAGAALAAVARAPRTWPAAVTTIGFVAVGTCAAWLLWPARTVAPATRVVAAVQGNIVQSLKWSEPARRLAIDRYTAMTLALRDRHPTLVLWPETVIPERLTIDPATQARIGAVAQALGATVVAGSIDAASPTEPPYANALFFYGPDGRLGATYAKQQLVPFVERIPGPAWLQHVPYASLASEFTPGTGPAVIGGVAPLICWESVFSDVAVAHARDAGLIAIATDDAWFGTTAGPYLHAQAASLRAVETGRWVLRAAATGISGIVAPDGTWRERTVLATQAAVVGAVGAPQPTAYVHYGPVPVGLVLAAVTIGGLVRRGRRA